MTLDHNFPMSLDEAYHRLFVGEEKGGGKEGHLPGEGKQGGREKGRVCRMAV